ncbi:hypothetical protein A4X13_0g1289 [Tilletia indica]|uniref:rRNA adenine N(6)-methyltransferase n=1 Tax=Tilletia indica TaxID=43049 RepID=A0A177TDZ0_9BASI|nr:hypothetical protein A4X13_0g1289 [Tilletia indica]
MAAAARQVARAGLGFFSAGAQTAGRSAASSQVAGPSRFPLQPPTCAASFRQLSTRSKASASGKGEGDEGDLAEEKLKRRGRPPKVVVEEPVKKQGRPRKVVMEEAEEVVEEREPQRQQRSARTEDPATRKSSGGRPRRSTLVGEAPAPRGRPRMVVTEAEKPVSKRGRPRKIPPTPTPSETEPTFVRPRRSSQQMATANALESDLIADTFSHPHLPDFTQWATSFSPARAFSGSRYIVANKNTAEDLVASLGLDRLAKKGIKTTVIEAYPGPGILTRVLLNHPAVEKVIAMEDNKQHLAYLDILKADPTFGHKLAIIRSSGYLWPSYDHVLNDGHLDHLKDRIRTSTGEPAEFSTEVYKYPADVNDPNWKSESPILFLAQLPSSVYGDQLFAQIIFAIATRRWLFRFSRVRLAFTMNKNMLARVAAPPGDYKYTRTSAVTNTLTNIIPTDFSSEDSLEPYSNHFYPFRQPVGARLLKSYRVIPNANIPAAATKLGIGWLRLEPKESLAITPDTFEVFEYLTRMMFVLRSQSVEAAMKRIGPGAENVIKMLNTRGTPEERVDPAQTVTSLTGEQWAGLSRMFKLWPFKPDILIECGRASTRQVTMNEG